MWKYSGEAGLDVELELVQRAVRSVPASGEVWARYMRIIVGFIAISSYAE
jgi:hypothetical protein